MGYVALRSYQLVTAALVYWSHLLPCLMCADCSSDNFGTFYEMQNDIFLGWYWTELLFKLFAVGFVQYVSDVWNWLDMVVVFGSTMQYASTYDKSARAFRVLRVFRLLPMLPQVTTHHPAAQYTHPAAQYTHPAAQLNQQHGPLAKPYHAAVAAAVSNLSP